MRNRRGFTMIELLVTMLVAGILLAIAVPTFSNLILNNRAVAQANSLVASFNYARNEAVKRGTAAGIRVCPSPDGIACGGTDWTLGWIVRDMNPAANMAAVLQAIPALAGANTLTPVGSPAGVTFGSSGALNPVPLLGFAIRICDSRGAQFARDVEINSVGRVASSQTPGSTVAGVALTCP